MVCIRGLFFDNVDDMLLCFQGKTFGWARGTDVSFSIETIKYYAGWADKICGQTIEVLYAL